MATYDYSKYYKVKNKGGYYDIYGPTGKINEVEGKNLFSSGFNVDFVTERNIQPTQLFNQPIGPQPKTNIAGDPTQLFGGKLTPPAQNNQYFAPVGTPNSTPQYSQPQQLPPPPPSKTLFGPSTPTVATTQNGQPLYQGTVQPQQPLQLTPDDFQQFYGDIDIAKSELEAARIVESTAFTDYTTAIKNLALDSQNLYKELFEGQDITNIRDAASKAYQELVSIDAQEQAAINKLRSQAQQTGKISGFVFAEENMIKNKFNADRLGAAAKNSVAQNNLETALKFADRAYDVGIKGLELKIDLAETIFNRATDLTDQQKDEYNSIIEQARDEIDKREEQRQDALDLYIEFSKAGVQNISPSMSVQQLQAAAGPVLSTIALNELERKRISTLQGTVTERQSAQRQAAIAQARPELENSRGTDGYVDPQVYTKLRSDYAEAIGNVSEFDDVFASLLSPQERARLGVGKTIGIKSTGETTGSESIENPFS